ncbi:hypothetical protein NQ317_010224 [Molorchus minor]|uniref:lysozyme n=1 Tax=Molorchus minor TaxID=1323400 RepID=A0ABQ9J475_9CUCU|nr:hypothetical protein NQ317_010224 [Molorchus minor]
MLFKQALLLFFIATYVDAIVYDRCKLANELKYVYNFPGHQISTWMCIIAHESIYDTAAMNPGSGDHGLFQISQLYWCSPPGDGFGCNAPCAKFRDDDIADDVQCAKRIFKEHSRISGDGFNAWAVYPLHCKNNTSRYIRGCFQTDVNDTSVDNNQTSNEDSEDSEEPLDEDDDGYEFPPLPSPPKTIENVISNDEDYYEFPPLPTASELQFSCLFHIYFTPIENIHQVSKDSNPINCNMKLSSYWNR